MLGQTPTKRGYSDNMISAEGVVCKKTSEEFVFIRVDEKYLSRPDLAEANGDAFLWTGEEGKSSSEVCRLVEGDCVSFLLDSDRVKMRLKARNARILRFSQKRPMNELEKLVSPAVSMAIGSVLPALT